jgi:hypothetical protein
MIPLIIFRTTESDELQIVIDNKNKVNVYGYITKELHVFDEVEVSYIHKNSTIILAKDIAQHIISSFLTALEEVLNNNIQLDPSITIGKVGYFFSEKTYMNIESKEKNDMFSHYWVWSSSTNIQTWLYNKDNKIYLEISQTYPWLFSDPSENERNISFQEYANNYKPIVLIALEKSLIQEWIKQCHALSQQMKTV